MLLSCRNNVADAAFPFPGDAGSRLQQFHDGGVGLAPTFAHSLQSVPNSLVAHVVEHGGHDPRPGAAEAIEVDSGACPSVVRLESGLDLRVCSG